MYNKIDTMIYCNEKVRFKMRRKSLILVQLTNMCNLSCEYCISDSCKYELNVEKLLQLLYKYYLKSDNKENTMII